jgi:membrane associated rhomboid family serine protease
MLTTLHALIFGWLGAITMFILTVSPTVFAVLDGPQASSFLRAYFPRLFRYEITVGLAIIGLSVVLSMNGTTYHYGIIVGLLVTVLAYLNLRVIMPKVNDVSDQLISDPNPQMKKKFALLHGLSVGFFGINALGMILLFTIGY